MYSQGKNIFTGQSHKPPIKLYVTFTSKNTHFTHPRCFTMIYENFTGQSTGHHRAYRAKLIWPPMFYYDTWKVPFLTNYSISSVQHKKWAKFTGQSWGKFLQTQNCFFEILQKFWNCNWNECVFVIFENVAIFHSLTPDVSLCPIA